MSGVTFSPDLMPGTLVRRYKRFMADVDLYTGGRVTAHCANSGSMLSVNTPGARVWLSKSDNPKRKLAYTWEAIEVGDVMVGVNTGWPNRIVAEGIAAGAIPELNGYATLRREVPFGARSRIDLMLEDAARAPCLIEVKNVTMRRSVEDGVPCEFPDSVTARGTKHLNDLRDAVAQGLRAIIFFVVQRADGFRVKVASDIDPVYDQALKRACAAGVEVLCYRCTVSASAIRLTGRAEFLFADAPVT